MTTLIALLPVAISAFIGVLVGFRYARKERERREQAFQADDKQHDLPFMTMVR
jgi:hypothetical protein